MKVLFICSANNPAMISPVIRNQGDALIEAGVSVEYFGIEGKGFIGYAQNLFMLRRLLLNKSYDLLHAHYGLSGIVALGARKREKLIISFMGDDLLGSNMPDGSITITSRMLIGLNNFLSKHCYDHCIVKSYEMSEALSCSNKTVIPNGVDMSVFVPADKIAARSKLGIGKDDKVAIFLGSPARPEKNHTLAMQAVGMSKYSDLKLLVITNIDHKALTCYYNAADVLLLTSFHEGSPNVIKEAMACNCPLVSTDVGDVMALTQDVEGCYTASYVPSEFAEKIDTAIQLGERGRSGGRARLSSLGLDNGTFSERMIRVYNTILEQCVASAEK